MPITVLSPFSDAESWTPQPQYQHPGSPGIERDYRPPNLPGQDTEMLETDDSNVMSSSFDHLSVHSADASHFSTSAIAPPFSSDSNLYRPRPFSTAPVTTGNNSDNINTGIDQHSTSGYGLGLRSRREQIDTTMDDHDSHPSSSHRRAPRLQMGFRADCEKCIDRVPGHYSHILWT